MIENMLKRLKAGESVTVTEHLIFNDFYVKKGEVFPLVPPFAETMSSQKHKKKMAIFCQDNNVTYKKEYDTIIFTKSVLEEKK